jgi:hypothetical protein
MIHGTGRSIAGIARNGLRTQSAHFDAALNHRDALRLFAEFVEQIEVETTSYCNRVCSFCPNSFIDRRSEQSPMPEPAWRAILEGLAEVGFRGTFVWSRYSEPLSEERIVERIKEVRRAAPACRIAINTNGDYLDRKYLDELRASGVDRLMVDLYAAQDESYSREMAAEIQERFLKRIERDCTILSESPELVARIEDKMEIITHVRNASTIKKVLFIDRGGLLRAPSSSRRTSPCFLPFKQLVIDWDGSVVPCCQIRSDAGQHADAVVARIGSPGVGLVDGYIALAAWRRGLTSFEPKAGPCMTCEYAAYADNVLTRSVNTLSSNVDGALRNVARTMLRPWLGRRHTW